MARRSLRACAGVLAPTLAGTLLAGAPTPAAEASPAGDQRVTKKNPTAYGWGGAVASVDPEATAAGLRVLRDGGNAVDAAGATAAALGVTEPHSAGIGGGGYFVYYDAKSRRVHTIDGRETAPLSMPATAFTDPSTEKPYPFEQLVTSGKSVGVPGTPATWERAGDALTSAAEIGAVAALGLRPGGYVLAAAGPARRGGGSAGVVVPTARR